MSVLDTLPGELLEAIVSNPLSDSISSIPTPKPSVLEILPPELLELIAATSDSLVALKSLCSIAKRYVRPTQGHLFRSVAIGSETQCENLVAVISAKPYLAQCVKNLQVWTYRRIGGMPWAVFSIALPVILLKLTGVESFSLINHGAYQMSWDDLQPALKGAMEDTMSRPSLTSVTLVNVGFSSILQLANFLARAKASLEKMALVGWGALLMPPLDHGPFLFQINPKEITIHSDMAWRMMHSLLLPHADCPPFIKSCAIHTLNLEAIDVGFIESINHVAPSLRILRIAPLDLPFADSPPILFHRCARLESLSLDFTKSSSLFLGNDDGSPIKWAIKVVNALPPKSFRTLKLGLSTKIIALFKDKVCAPTPGTLDEVNTYINDSPYPPLADLSFLLSRNFLALRSVEIFIPKPEAEAEYRPTLDIAKDYLAAGWRAKARGLDLVAEGVVTVEATCNKYEPDFY